VLILTVLLTCRALLGCATSYEISASPSLPIGVVGEVDKRGRTIVRLDDVDVRIEVRNPRASGVSWGLAPMFPPLPIPESASDLTNHVIPNLIFLEFRPTEEGFTFRPMAVLLIYGGQSLSPKAFIGPGRPRHDGNVCMDPAGGELEKSTTDQSFGLSAVPERTCFVLQFYNRLSPDVKFRLALRGLNRNGDPVDFPELHFEKWEGRGDPNTSRPTAFQD
jgi:hypothetical protein